jgi:hypothetical protein
MKHNCLFIISIIIFCAFGAHAVERRGNDTDSPKGTPAQNTPEAGEASDAASAGATAAGAPSEASRASQETDSSASISDPEPSASTAGDEVKGADPAPAKKISHELLDGADESGKAAEEKKKKKKKKVEVKTRVHVRWEMEPDDSDELENRFLIRRARLKLLWHPKKWITAKLQVGFEKITKLTSVFKDAYIHLSPSQYVEVRVGQFKKPFSRLELRSSGKLRLAERGDGNSFIIEDLLYGGRDIGIQLSGRLVKSVKLDYALGFFNGTGTIAEEVGNAKDLVARLEVDPSEWIGVGVNSSLKFFDDDVHKDRDEPLAWAVGADTVFRFFGVRLHLEGILAEDHQYTGNYPDLVLGEMPLTLSGVGILSYEYTFNTSRRLSVEPLFKMEVLDPNLDFIDDQVLLLNPGFNVYIGKYLRLMLHAEFRRGGENHLSKFRDREKLMLQLCLDI